MADYEASPKEETCLTSTPSASENEKVESISVSETQSFTEEERKDIKTVCLDCGGQFGGRSCLKSHKKRCLGPLHLKAVNPENPLQCLKCRRVFATDKSIRAHVMYIIGNGLECTNTKCPKCGINIYFTATMETHKRCCKGDKQKSHKTSKGSKAKTKDFKCHICSEQFNTSSKYAAHMERGHTVHDGNLTLFTCSDCGDQFSTSEGLKSHKRRRCLGPSRFKVADPENPLRCLKCGRSFANESGLRVHLAKTAARGIECINEKCPKCDNIFHNPHNLKTHIGRCKRTKNATQIAHAKYAPKFETIAKCPKCGEEFATVSDMRRHRAKCNPKGSHQQELKKNFVDPKNPLRCLKCGKSFVNEAGILGHITRGFDCSSKKCPNCLKEFSTTASMRHHANKCQFKGKLNHMAKCKNGESKSRTLKKVANMDSQKNLSHQVFKCHVCSTQCNTNTDLNYHMENFHRLNSNFDYFQCMPINAEEKSSCQKCGLDFNCTSDFSDHVCEPALTESNVKEEVGHWADLVKMEQSKDIDKMEVLSESGNEVIASDAEIDGTASSNHKLDTSFTIKNETMDSEDKMEMESQAENKNQDVMLPSLPQDSGQDSKICVVEYLCCFCDFGGSSMDDVSMHMKMFHNFDPASIS